jgi:hypothetical protein
VVKRHTRPPDDAMGFVIHPGSIQDIFLRRSENVLRRLAENADEAVLAEALTAPSDVGTLARVLGDMGAIGPSVVDLEPLAPMIALNAQHRETLLKRADGVLSAAEVGHLLHLTRQAVDKRRKTGALLALRQGSDWRYPRCQFTDADTVPGLAEVVRGMSGSGPWVTLDFLLAPDAVLDGMTPLKALSRGDEMRERVMRLVRSEHDGDGFS